MDPKDVRTKAIFDLTRQIYHCAVCQKFVIGDYVVVDNNSYHTSCFKCQQCKSDILKGYHSLQGKLLCPPCYLRTLPVCNGCKKPIEDSNCVKINEECSHFNCFVCVQCKKTFSEGRYYVYGKECVCLEHYWERKEKETSGTEGAKPTATA